MKTIYQLQRGFLAANRQSRFGAIALTATLLLSSCNALESGVSRFNVDNDNSARQPIEQDEFGTTGTETTIGGSQDLIGQRVTTRGNAGERIGENAFVMTSNLFNGREVLVFNNTGQPFELPELSQNPIAPVQVTGDVRQFTVRGIQREYDQALDPTLFAQFEDQPVIVANSLALAPDAAALRDNPDAFYGRRIIIEGEIADILAPDTFTLSNGRLFEDGNMLVVGATPDTRMTQGEAVTAIGELRPFVPSTIQRDYNLAWDSSTQEQLERQYANQPTLIAREIYPVDQQARAVSRNN
ncbi:hypothetical protein IQ268_06250 [Oculatella sp. LEGE 06141]|uniref:hypothetical protein n=1 Tax=Oculatella sp. LEGE 06141 TaxID=1828648 RepID=UPI00187F3756|nr:hypothetical protein [Oculatella sp. LEGE 06141]MBE9178185.1 hypothetical protein [Oculatella sp. LEGE 06141]